MTDHLIFGRRDEGETGDVDVDELREALAAAPARIPEEQVVERTRVRRPPRPQRRRRRRPRWVSTLIALGVLIVIVIGLVVGYFVWRSNVDAVEDYAGSGDTEVVVRIQGGDTPADIAQTLADAGVVASTEAFEAQAAMDGDVQALRPGYYKVRQNSSAQAAADALVAVENQVGRVRLIPGRQLADVTARSTDPAQAATVVPGYISEITAAACVPLNGEQDCFTTDELWRVAETADPAMLGVVEWAADHVLAAPEPRKRLEGVILPGDFDIPPGSTAEQALQAVVSASAAVWNSTDIAADSRAIGISPYQAATIASIVEREGIVAEMPTVAAVVYNRLAVPMKLEMDSTVNYALDRASIATSAEDRANPSPYNTYVHMGLPPTPITSPGPDAIAATLDPADGRWLYFVKLNLDGQSCFSETPEQHAACVEQARANGVFG